MRIVITSRKNGQVCVSCFEGKEILNRFHVAGRKLGAVVVQRFAAKNIDQFISVDLNPVDLASEVPAD